MSDNTDDVADATRYVVQQHARLLAAERAVRHYRDFLDVAVADLRAALGMPVRSTPEELGAIVPHIEVAEQPAIGTHTPNGERDNDETDTGVRG